MKTIDALNGIMNAAKKNEKLMKELKNTDVPDTGLLDITVKATDAAKKNESGIWVAPGEVTIFYPGNIYEKKTAWINVETLMKER